MLCGADRKPRTKEAESRPVDPGGGSEMANSLMDFTALYEYLQCLPWLSVIEQSRRPSYTCSYLKYELITEFLDKVPVDQHGNITTIHLKKKAFDRYIFQCGKSSRLYSLQSNYKFGDLPRHFGVP